MIQCNIKSHSHYIRNLLKIHTCSLCCNGSEAQYYGKNQNFYVQVFYNEHWKFTWSPTGVPQCQLSFSNCLTFHLLSVYRSRRAKMFWGGVCLVSMLFFLYMLMRLIMKYFSYPVVVNVDEVCRFRTLHDC